MNRIFEINGVERNLCSVLVPVLTGLLIEADGDLCCQSGARWEDINQTLREKGIPLFFPVRTLL
jgi:hypothetical protein